MGGIEFRALVTKDIPINSRLNVAESLLIALLAMQLYSPLSSEDTLHKLSIAVTTVRLPAVSSATVIFVLLSLVKIWPLRVKMKSSINVPLAVHAIRTDSKALTLI